jgi:tRNA A-37 threonylcarbamoyl transferase component Bud32
MPKRGACFTFPAPPGFRLVEQGEVVALLREDRMAALIGAGLLERGGLLEGRSAEDSYQGRGSTAIVRVGAERLVVRRFLPGGLLRFLRPSSFATPERPFREVALYEHLRARGFPTLEPVAAVARRRGARWILHLVTRELRAARELLTLLAPRAALASERRDALRAAGRCVRRMHEEGLRHADLHLKNLLLCDGEVYVIDLDRSRLELDLPPAARVANLERLWRYARRRLELSRGPLALRRDAARFLRAYEPEREARRALAREVLRVEARGRWRHRLGWWFEARLARWRELRRDRS